MRFVKKDLIFRYFKIIPLIIFVFTNTIAFGAVSGLVDTLTIPGTAAGQKQPTGILFNPGGTKMNVIGNTTKQIIRYTLTSPFDLSDATLETGVCAMGGTDKALNAKFNNDGTKLFVAETNGDTVDIYKLSIAYDITTCEKEDDQAFGGSLEVRDISFSSDGRKIFIFDSPSGETSSVKQYSLSAPFNLTNPILTNQHSGLEEFNTFEQGLAFSSDGTKMFITGNNNPDIVTEFTLGTPFDLSDVKHEGFYDVSSNITHISAITFNDDGSKMFLTDFFNNDLGRKVLEYDLTCGFGVIKCIDPTANKDDVASIETQSESAKKLIQHTTYPVINRMQWLRRNNSRGNLTNQNIKFQFNNEILNSLSKTLLPVYLSNYNSSNTDNENSSWSLWSEGTISVGRIGDTSVSSSKNINTSAITLGADKRGKDNIMRGIALRFGSDDVDVGDLGSALNMSTFGLTFYETKPKGEERFTDHLLGLSFINSDLINNSGSTSTNGERSGEQIYGSFSLRDTLSKNNLNFTPKIKIDYGVTHFAEYTETGAAGLNLKFKDQYIGNFITSVGANIDKKFDLKNKTFLPYFDFNYSADMSPSTKQKFSYSSSGDKYTLDNINNDTHSVHTGIGFDLITDSGFNLMTKYTRDQTTGGSYNDNFVIAGDYRASYNSSYALSIHETSTEVSFKSKNNNINFDVTSNLDFFAEDPEYGIYLKLYTLN